MRCWSTSVVQTQVGELSGTRGPAAMRVGGIKHPGQQRYGAGVPHVRGSEGAEEGPGSQTPYPPLLSPLLLSGSA